MFLSPVIDSKTVLPRIVTSETFVIRGHASMDFRREQSITLMLLSKAVSPENPEIASRDGNSEIVRLPSICLMLLKAIVEVPRFLAIVSSP